MAQRPHRDFARNLSQILLRKDSFVTSMGAMTDAAATPRHLRDPRALRALAHPLRIKLLEALVTHGTLTATQASELFSTTPASCSFHLRELARFGFVERADGGHGRERPWRAVAAPLHFDPHADDPDEAIAASELARVLQGRWIERFEGWSQVAHTYAAPWRHALSTSQFVVWLTPTETTDLLAELARLIQERYPDRLSDPSTRPPDAMAVEIILDAHPFDLEAGGAQHQ